eukprot:Rhum_TRINITY_DN4281_c0_g1::Rhum_TRINITY_DN4281_c0_g1_i1::g.13682::m.13682
MAQPGVPNGPLFSDGKLNVPVSVCHQACGGLMDIASQCLEDKGKGSDECKDVQTMANECIKHSIYNYVSLRKMCKREYGQWATCMNKGAEDGLTQEDADSKCGMYREPLLSCSQEFAEPVAESAMERNMKPQDIPEQS